RSRRAAEAVRGSGVFVAQCDVGEEPPPDVQGVAGLAHDRIGQRDEGRHAAPGLLMLDRVQPLRSWTRRPMTHALVGVALVVSIASASAYAQRRFFDGFGGSRGNFKPYPNTAYDGRFNFVRVVYECDLSGYWYRGLPSWAHGYPMAERNLMK